MKRFLRSFLPCASLCLLLAACANEKPIRSGPNSNNVDKRDVLLTGEDGALFQPNVEAGKDTIVVSDFVSIRSGDVEAAERSLMDKILKKSIEVTLKDLLRDPALYKEKENELQRLFIQQYQKFISAQKVLEKKVFGDNSKLGAKVQVSVSRDKLTKGIATEIRRNEAARIILIVRKPSKSATVDGVSQEYVENLTESLSGDMVERGFEPKLWRDIRRNIAESRDAGDAKLESFLEKFVEDSEWSNPKDERYQLPLVILRARGRFLVGFRFEELGKKGLTYRCSIRADIYDLFNQRSLGVISDNDKEPIGSQSLVSAREKCVFRAAKRLNGKIGTKIQDFLRIVAKRKKDYEFNFVGFSEDDISRLETLMAGIISEDVETESDGKSLKVKARIDRSPIPVRDEMKKTLKQLGFNIGSVKRSNTTMTFTKQ